MSSHLVQALTFDTGKPVFGCSRSAKLQSDAAPIQHARPVVYEPDGFANHKLNILA